MKQFFIIANGEFDAETAQRLQAASIDRLIAVDGGARHCLVLGLLPDLIVGDLDSLDPDTAAHFEKAGVIFERHPAHKDETDLELAMLGAIHQGAECIVLAGALGGRLDMALANVLLLTHPRLCDVHVELWQHRQTAWLLRPPGEEVHGQPGDTLSLIPLQCDAEGLTTDGLAYPLKDETLFFGQTRGLSNVMTEPTARIQLCAGLLLAVYTPGRA